MAVIFGDFDVSDFWEPSDYADNEYVEPAPSDDVVRRLESKLGYRLPRTYVELARVQNGGIPKNTCHKTQQPTGWANDHVKISGIYSIGSTKPYSLGGMFRTQFWISEWRYPRIGIYFGNTPTAGHDMFCLDYRKCGPEGEPQVVNVDQEAGYRVVVVAANFEKFVRGLEPESAFPFEVD
jgi:hypothetical protein